MTQSIQAIFEDGVLRPLRPLDLPDNLIVEIDIRDLSDDEYARILKSELASIRERELKDLDLEFENYEKLHPRRSICD